MSERGDYSVTSWVGTHDFRDARATYRSSVVDRSYSTARETKVAARDLIKTGIVLDTPTLVIVSDVTGSMGEWPAVMFSKLPYLIHELHSYLGDTAKLLIAAVGDATSDRYPLQVHEPKSTFDEAKTALTSLVIEGGGGSQTKESYELAAGYFLRAVDVARTVKPILVFIGDESPYEQFTGAQCAVLGIAAESMSTVDLFRALNEVYDVYLIHKPYGSHSPRSEEVTERVRADWGALLPPEHLIPLDMPERVVDIMFGILANATGKIEDFKREITSRQTPEQVVTVFKSLSGLYSSAPRELSSGKSTMHKLAAGLPSKPLL